MSMTLQIKDTVLGEETAELARQLSEVTGETIPQAVSNALRERLRSVAPAMRSQEEKIASIKEIVARLAKLPVLDNRSPDEIIGYNEHGHFD